MLYTLKQAGWGANSAGATSAVAARLVDLIKKGRGVVCAVRGDTHAHAHTRVLKRRSTQTAAQHAQYFSFGSQEVARSGLVGGYDKRQGDTHDTAKTDGLVRTLKAIATASSDKGWVGSSVDHHQNTKFSVRITEDGRGHRGRFWCGCFFFSSDQSIALLSSSITHTHPCQSHTHETSPLSIRTYAP